MQRDSVQIRFHQAVERAPKSVAIRHGEQCITYEELSERVRSLSAALASQGETPASLSCILADNEVPSIIAAFAIVVAGQGYVPLSVYDPAELIKERLEISGTKNIFTSREHEVLARSIAHDDVQIFIIEDYWDQSEPAHVFNGAFNLSGSAYMLFTSGSTGTPKAITHSHSSLLRSVDCFLADTQLTTEDNVSLMTNLGFTPSVFCLFGALLSGATLHPRNLALQGVNGLTDWVCAGNITHLYTTPTIYRRWLATLDKRLSASDLKMIMLAGEPMLSSDVNLFKEKVPPNVALYNGMGTSETSCAARYFVDLDKSYPDGRVPIGIPYKDVEARIEDGSGQLLGPSETGELVLVGTHFTNGYAHADPDSLDRFQPVPNTNKWRYSTGDLAMRLEDGSLVHCGRRDGQVKVNGVRIETDEIESVLLDFEGVDEVAIIAVETEEHHTSLTAYIGSQKSKELTVLELRQFLRSKLPSAFIPSTFILLDTLPMLSAGKVDKVALRSMNLTSPQFMSETVEPRDHFENEVLEAFRRAFDNPEFGFGDDFFEHGGDSLRALEVAIAIEERTGYALSASGLMTYPTPINVAHHLKTQMQSHSKNDIVQFSSDSAQVSNNGTLICIPGVGGHALSFRDLASALPANISMHALEIQGLDGRAAPFGSIKAIASYFADQIRNQFPTGPLYFAGYSMGGQIAFELARLFKLEGREIGQLILIDAYSTKYFAFERRYRIREARIAAIRKLGIFTWLGTKLKTAFTSDNSPLSAFSPSSEVGRLTGMDAEVQLNKRMKAIEALLYNAAHAYEPTPFELPTISIEASAPADPPGDCYSYWDTLTQHKIRHVEVDADHLSIMKSDGAVRKVAQLISKCVSGTDEVISTENVSKSISDLFQYWSADGNQVLTADIINPGMLPQSVASLLNHSDSMTSTLSRHYDQKIDVNVLAKSQIGGHLVRKVSLKPADIHHDCAMAVIRIDLKALDTHSRQDILDGSEPFGAIMDRHNVQWKKEPTSFFTVHPDEDIAKRLNCAAHKGQLFGRHNVLTLENGHKLADVIEVVPDTSPTLSKELH